MIPVTQSKKNHWSDSGVSEEEALKYNARRVFSPNFVLV